MQKEKKKTYRKKRKSKKKEKKGMEKKGKRNKKRKSKKQHLAIQQHQFQATCDCCAITSTTTSILELFVLNLLLNYGITGTRFSNVIMIAFLIQCNSKATRKH